MAVGWRQLVYDNEIVGASMNWLLYTIIILDIVSIFVSLHIFRLNRQLDRRLDTLAEGRMARR
jgi:hypothetical protein